MESIQALSIGYEGRTIQDLIDLLKTHEIEQVIDVRLMPVSRRKYFCKNNLSAYLREEGIEYLHIRSAGNPYYKQRDDVELCLKLYTGYLKDHPDVMDSVFSKLSDSHTAVLCYERDHVDCHRNVLLRQISKSVHKIEVILAD
ncbi:MAG: DUF488 domain-containing protein [bacterium]